MSTTPLSDMVEKMLSDGLPPDTIVAALRAAEQAIVASIKPSIPEDATAARRRAKDRERYRRKKETVSVEIPPKLTDSCNSYYTSNSHRNPPKPTEIHRNGVNLPSSLISFLREEEDKEEDKRGVQGGEKIFDQNSQAASVTKFKRTGSLLPEDWTPSDKHYAAGQQIGMSRDAVDRSAEDMRLWATANQHRQVARKANWEATFLGWIRREAKSRPPQPAKRYFRV